MNRQGRVLVVDDMEQWREELVEILQNDGFQADSAPDIDEALTCLQQGLYHILVLDLRIGSKSGNSDGINLLNDMESSGLSDGIKVIVLSAHGTLERVREAFKDHKVADFLSKDKLTFQKFLDSVRKVFSEQVNINLGLEIHTQHIESLEQVVVGLDISGTKVEAGTDLQKRIAGELEDLLCRLFYRASSILVRPLTPGHSGASVLRVHPFYSTGGGGHEVVVKFGGVRKIKHEYHNFMQHVQPFLGGGRNTFVLDFRCTPRLGGIIYSLLGTINDELQDFGQFYDRSELDKIKKVLSNLFDDTCSVWYANRTPPRPFDLSADYQDTLGYKPGDFHRLIDQYLISDQDHPKLVFRGLSRQTFTNPLPILTGSPLIWPTHRCITHGDFNPRNLLVDSDGHVWMIDFQETRESHVLRDIATLDSTLRFQLLTEDDATLRERLQMEKALCSIERFSQVRELEDRFTTKNQALAKCYATIVYLRGLAAGFVGQYHDMSEYYIALFYNAMNTLRFSTLPAIQREHALLCASLLADRLVSTG